VLFRSTWTALERQPFTENVWTREDFDLGSRIPLTDKMRFRAWTCDGGGGSLLEAALDDFAITTRVFSLVAAEPVAAVPATLAIESTAPNPSQGPGSVTFTIPRPSPVTLRLYDSRGRLVRSVWNGAVPPGRYTIPWDGRDQSGRMVPPGAYLYRLDAGGVAATRKIVVAG